MSNKVLNPMNPATLYNFYNDRDCGIYDRRPDISMLSIAAAWLDKGIDEWDFKYDKYRDYANLLEDTRYCVELIRIRNGQTQTV